jgi:exopolyphosphatase / guanosine-5'-triphosphate,3'-diphosphate pyrophosphatase
VTSTRVAAFDCGTNSLRLLIADLDPESGEMTELVREMRIVRVGQGVDRTGRIAEESMTRTFAALDEYAALVAEHRPTAMRFGTPPTPPSSWTASGSGSAWSPR